MTISQVDIDSGGHLYYKANTGGFNLNGGATAQQGGFPYTLSDYTTPLTTLSSRLASMAPNSLAATNGSGAFVFNATPGADGIAIFSFTGAALATALQNNLIEFYTNDH